MHNEEPIFTGRRTKMLPGLVLGNQTNNANKHQGKKKNLQVKATEEEKKGGKKNPNKKQTPNSNIPLKSMKQFNVCIQL